MMISKKKRDTLDEQGYALVKTSWMVDALDKTQMKLGDAPNKTQWIGGCPKLNWTGECPKWNSTKWGIPQINSTEWVDGLDETRLKWEMP